MCNLTLTDPHDAVALMTHYLCRSFDTSLFRSVAFFNFYLRAWLHIC